jgi:Lon protease-like protein
MQILDALPLFPLSDVVLLPQVSVPLYIFEPRYRQMTRDALAGDRQIGMVAVQPSAIASMQGDPLIFDVGCVGRIAHCEERPDGTFQLLLMGDHRFRIQQELTRPAEQLYRTARVELLDDVEPDGEVESARLEASRSQLLELLSQIVSRARPHETTGDRVEAFAKLESARLINALAQSIAFDPIERQQLLEANSIESRFEIMVDLLRFRLAETSTLPPNKHSLPN